MKKGLKYFIWIVVIALVAYNSVYFKKLSEVKATTKTFNAEGFGKDMLADKLPPLAEKAITIDQLITQLNTDDTKTFADYGHSLAIGSIHYFLIKGSGTVTEIGESDIQVTTPANNDITIESEFIFGNAVRDASGLVNVNDFANTIDLNNISAEINKIIRTKVVPPFKSAVKQGDTIEFTGAIALNQVHLNLRDIEIVPVSLKILK